MRTLPSWIRNTPIAHRGLHDSTRPENSLAAFRAASDHGYAVELDVHLLADGNVVVFHDDTLHRLCNDARRIDEITAGNLLPLRISNTDEPIPLLGEVLSVIAGTTPVLIELKSFATPGPLEAAVSNLLDSYSGEFAIQSFNMGSVQWFKDNHPHKLRGALSGGSTGGFNDFEELNAIQPDFIGFNIRLLPADGSVAARARGVPVLGWTVKSSKEEAKVRGDCDNIIFEGFHPTFDNE